MNLFLASVPFFCIAAMSSPAYAACTVQPGDTVACTDADETYAILPPDDPSVDMAGGNDTLNVTMTGTYAGNLAGGTGSDTLNINLAGNGNISGNVAGFEQATLRGSTPQIFSIDGIFGEAGSRLTLGTGTTGLRVSGTLHSDLDMGGRQQLTVTAGAILNGRITNASFMAGNVTIEFANASESYTLGNIFGAFNNLTTTGPGTLVFTPTSQNKETIHINNGGNVLLTSGTIIRPRLFRFDSTNHHLTLINDADIRALAIDIANPAGFTVSVILDQGRTRTLNGTLTGHITEFSGGGTFIGDTTRRMDQLFLDGVTLRMELAGNINASIFGKGGAETIEMNAGRITGDIDLAAGNDRLVLSGGQIVGNVGMGAGNDRVVLTTAPSPLVSGTVSGGTDIDTLELRNTGDGRLPTTFDLSGFSQFEVLESGGRGVNLLTGNRSFGNVLVAQGSLYGLTGSTFQAPSITVASGARFGSAGNVIGNILVQGVLAPSFPLSALSDAGQLLIQQGTTLTDKATMNITGNIVLASGSRLILDVQPSAHDRLNVSGNVVVEGTAALDITGLLPHLPIAPIDLVVAGGTISGSFATINKSSTVFGFVRVSNNRVQLVGEFENDPEFDTNTASSIAYVNTVAASGHLVQAITDALPVLVEGQGRSNAAAFSELTPEAYGSASELALHEALTLADAMRTVSITSQKGEGLFGFGQYLRNRTELDGSAADGTSDANMDVESLVGGIGYGFAEDSRAGFFISQSSTDQSLSRRRAMTDGESTAVGMFADMSFGGFSAHALILRSKLDGYTSRPLQVDGNTVSANYAMETWLVDARIGHTFYLGGISAVPGVGLTWARSKRDAIIENGSAFALAVDKGLDKALFGDASLRLASTQKLGSLGILAYVEAGYRHTFDHEKPLVGARFVNTTGPGLLARGIERPQNAVRLSAGLGADLLPGVRFNIGYSGEFGEYSSHSLITGLSARF